jgi:hypothetical protein
MIECKVEALLTAPLEKVWPLCADYGNLDWFKGHGIAGAKQVDTVGEGIGMERHVHMEGFDTPIIEVLTALDTSNHSFSYEILPHPLMPFSDYKVDAKLTDNGNGKTLALWVARFNTSAMREQEAIAMMTDTYGKMLRCLEDAANT